jgi:Cu+-exporting ATPase
VHRAAWRGLILGAAGVAVLDAGILAGCDDVLAVAGALRLARATRAVAGAGMRWAVGYTVVVVPVAALGYLSPLLAVPAAALSSLLVLARAAGRAGRDRRGRHDQPGSA